MKRRSLATLAALVALPAGILTTVAVSSAGAQSIPHIHVLDATTANRVRPVNRVGPVNRVIHTKAHCVAKNMNHAHTATTLKCVGDNVSAGAAATAAAQVTQTSNTRIGTAAADSGAWYCIVQNQVINPDGTISTTYYCWWDPYVGGGGGGGGGGGS